MKKKTRDILVMALLSGLCFVVFIWCSIAIRQAHDAEVRRQAIETCKEFK